MAGRVALRRLWGARTGDRRPGGVGQGGVDIVAGRGIVRSQEGMTMPDEKVVGASHPGCGSVEVQTIPAAPGVGVSEVRKVFCPIHAIHGKEIK